VNILLHLAGITFFQVSFYMKLYDLASEDPFSPSKYADLQTYAFLDNLSCVCFSLSAIFYPFRFFMVLARFSWASTFVNLVNNIYRTLPGLALFLTICLSILFGFTLAFYLVFVEHMHSCKDYWSTLFFITTQDIFAVAEFREFFSHQRNSNLAIFVLLL